MKKYILFLLVLGFAFWFSKSFVYALPAGSSCSGDAQCDGCLCCNSGTCGGGTSCTAWCSSGYYCGSSGCEVIPSQSLCNNSCPSGKTHKTECSGVESNCSALSQPYAWCWTYTCCDCSTSTPTSAAPTAAAPTAAQCASCTGSSVGADDYCTLFTNSSPIFSGLIIKNNSGNIVSAESGNRNQICQTAFNGSRSVTFEVSASDSDGDSLTITLSWNGKNIPMAGSVGTITFPDNWNDGTAYPLMVTVADGYGGSDTDSSRNLKIWDCKVPISGTIYDGSAGLSCPTIGFSQQADKNALNFKSLVFTRSGVDLNMTINSDGISYNSGSNNLTWGLNGYFPSLNSDIALALPKMRSQGSICDWWIDTTNVDPYSNNPSFVADFSGIVDQDPWWQANNGGVISNLKINSRVPVTCSTDNCKISRNALSASVTISNTGRSATDSQFWSYSGASAKLANINTNYSYFFNQYFIKNGVGTTLVGNKTTTDIGAMPAAGVYFIDGNLTIDNPITVTAGNFLMIVVKGDINISNIVNRVDGILVAQNINATGTSNNQLVFNGSLFAFNNIDFSRGYTVKSDNNTSPAVVVNYNPQLIFNLPGSVTKVLTNWQWGN